MNQLNPYQWATLLGRKIHVFENNKLIEEGVLIGVSIRVNGSAAVKIRYTEYNDGKWWHIGEHVCKPILKTWDQLTPEEEAHITGYYYCDAENHQFKEINSEGYRLNSYDFHYWKVEEIDTLTRMGIDLRGYIPLKLAIKYDPNLHGEWR